MIQHDKNLMTRMLKRAARARREHGIALLFTLCILSMALITAMIFSSNASTNRKIASAYVDTSAARILADGVVNRAILALIQSDNAAYVCSHYNTNHPSGKADDYAADWIWKMEKNGVFTFNNGPLRFSSDKYYDPTDSRCPSWEYVYGTTQDDVDNDHILGRYAYVAIGQNDQLNPNAIGYRDYRDFDLVKSQKRLGRWTCEPYFIFKSTKNNWDYSEKSPVISPETIQKKYSDPGWTDLDVFIDDLAGSGSSTNKQLKMMIDQYFDISSQGEYNKYRLDGKAAGDLTKHDLTDNDEKYRFPLLRNDWDSISPDKVKQAIPWFQNTTNGVNVDQVVANLINYNASVSRPPVDDGQNWFTGEVRYTGNKRTPYINEVDADVSIGGSLGVRMMERYMEDPSNPSSSWKFRLWYTGCTYSHEITIRVETVNMYPAPGDNNGAISVRNPILVGEISYDHWNENGNSPGFWATETIRFDASNQPWSEVLSSGSDAGYRVYTFLLDNSSVGNMTTEKIDGFTTPIGHEGRFYDYVKVKNVTLKLDRVVLQDTSGRNADLSLLPAAPSGETGFKLLKDSDVRTVAGLGDEGSHFYFDTQANDPRQNLGRNDWSTPLYSEKSSDVKATIGSRNNLRFDTNRDYESQDDPAYNAGNKHISTAYIRHGKMESLWELGAIHRGAPWQTLNLKCGSKDGIHMGKYEDGDGHILDQVALTGSTEDTDDSVLGMINLNCVASFGGSSAPFAFKSLFTRFPVYQTYENMNKSGVSGRVSLIEGDSVDSEKTGKTDADTYARDLSEAVTFAISHGHYLRRTAVLPTTYPASGSQMENIIPKNVPDAQAEEIFCRVVNLLKWNRQQTKRATVLVLAQTIRDVGGDSLSLNKAKPSNKSSDLLRDTGFQAYSSASKKILNTSGDIPDAASYYSRNVKFRQYDPLFDQITGEAKIIVRLEWDESANNDNGAWKVTRKEYAE